MFFVCFDAASICFLVTTKVNCFLSSIFFLSSFLLFFPSQSLISFLLVSLSSFTYLVVTTTTARFLYFFHFCRFSTQQLHFPASGSDKTVTRRRRIFYTNMSMRRKNILVQMCTTGCSAWKTLHIDCRLRAVHFFLFVLTVPTFEL